MTSPRPAETVMLIREIPDSPEGLIVFLMRRHAAMELVARAMVFSGGGVDDRDRNVYIAWAGPLLAWWAQRFGVTADLVEALVCATARETFEETGVLFAGPVGRSLSSLGGIVTDASVYGEGRRALADRTLSFADFLHRENLVLRSDLLRPWVNWVTPEAEPTRRYDTYFFFVGVLPEGQRPHGENIESDRTFQAVADDFAANRNFLLPPNWTQLGALIGHTVADVLAVERQVVFVAATSGEAGRQLGDRVFRLRSLQPGADFRWIVAVAVVVSASAAKPGTAGKHHRLMRSS